jgi:arylsulfatase
MGRLENTLVLFASDNGGSAEVVRIKNSSGEIGTMTRWTSVCGNWANVSNTPFRKYKNYSHEGGICTPLIAHWPAGIKNPGRFVHAPGHFIDFMATFIDITGAQYPTQLRGQKVAPLQGVSFLPALRNETPPERAPIFWEWGRGRAVRKGKWKLVSLKNKWELYDIDADRTETTDLASGHPDKVRELSALWEKWREGCKKI